MEEKRILKNHQFNNVIDIKRIPYNENIKK